eukprot:scaffold177554_cov26-Tisochrysis_lutea.AAC.2
MLFSSEGSLLDATSKDGSTLSGAPAHTWELGPASLPAALATGLFSAARELGSTTVGLGP